MTAKCYVPNQISIVHNISQKPGDDKPYDVSKRPFETTVIVSEHTKTEIAKQAFAKVHQTTQGINTDP